MEYFSKKQEVVCFPDFSFNKNDMVLVDYIIDAPLGFSYSASQKIIGRASEQVFFESKAKLGNITMSFVVLYGNKFSKRFEFWEFYKNTLSDVLKKGVFIFEDYKNKFFVGRVTNASDIKEELWCGASFSFALEIDEVLDTYENQRAIDCFEQAKFILS